MKGSVLRRGLVGMAPVFGGRKVTPDPTMSIPMAQTLLPDIEAGRIPKSLAIASGKGGAGKSFIATNLAITLARNGSRVLLFDADLGMNNDHLHLGLQPKYHVGHFLSGLQRIEDILIQRGPRLHFLPGGSGVSDLSVLSKEKWEILLGGLDRLSHHFDLLLIDLPAGIAPQVIRFLKMSRDICLVTTPEMPDLLDLYALIKAAYHHCIGKEWFLIMNKSMNAEEADAAIKKLQFLTGRYMRDLKLNSIGWVSDEAAVRYAIRKRVPTVLAYPDSNVARQLVSVAQVFQKEKTKEETCLPWPLPTTKEDREKQPPRLI